MPGETRTIDGGLGAPARKRRGAQSAAGGSFEGDPKPEGREPESDRRIEGIAEHIGGIPVIDPLTVPDNVTGTGDHQPKRRGRPRGSTNKKEETVSNLAALLKIERLLITGCFFLGNIASAPELHISESEAAEIADALKELSKHYPIGMSEKTIAWVNLSFAVGGVFGPRIVAIVKRPAVKKQVAEKASSPYQPVNGSISPASAPAASAATVPSQLWNEGDDGEV
jgi:hypothetical protein